MTENLANNVDKHRGHDNGPILGRQVNIGFWHCSTLQEKVLHLILEIA